MPRRGDGRATESELRKFRIPCPRAGCGGFASQTVLSRAAWKSCLTCGHEWDHNDGAGRTITREQRDELTRPRGGGRNAGEAEERRAQARRKEQYRQEADEMKKTKKGAGKTKKSSRRKKAKKG